MSYEAICEKHGLWIDHTGGGCSNWVYGSRAHCFSGFTLWVERLNSHRLDDDERAPNEGVDIALEDNAADNWAVCWAAYSEAEFETLLTNAIQICDAMNRQRSNHA